MSTPLQAGDIDRKIRELVKELIEIKDEITRYNKNTMEESLVGTMRCVIRQHEVVEELRKLVS